MNKQIYLNFISLIYTALIACGITCWANAAAGSDQKYNVVFIAIDDLNDWVGPLGGNPQVKTPNLDRFAEESITFLKAYCPSTVCGPSRSAILSGKYANNTGLYGNVTDYRQAPKVKDLESLPQYFGNRGYHTLSSGKIFHQQKRENGVFDYFQDHFHEFKEAKAKKWKLKWKKHPKKEGVKAFGGDMKWGAFDHGIEQTKDFTTMEWGAKQLNRDFNGKPFFMALGISQPHLPWFVPQEFYDMYPLENIKLPVVKKDDYDDIIRKDGTPRFTERDKHYEILEHNNMHKEAVQAYLANATFVDACLGHFFDALRNSKYYENTIVMIWSDHGWHLGEKLRYGKVWMWEESARVPFFVRVPGFESMGKKTDSVVNLVDMYPTLLELCGLSEYEHNDGRSFLPVLENPETEWNHPTLTTWQQYNHSITDGKYRYITYGKDQDTEELYDLDNDPYQHYNLLRNPEYVNVVKRLSSYLPTVNEPNSPFNTSHKDLKKK